MACDVTTTRKVATDTLELLGNPALLSSEPASVYAAINRALSYYTAEAHLSEVRLLLADYRLTTIPQRDEYLLDIPDWGDPVLCESIPDGWPNDVPFSRFEVDFVSVENQADYAGTRPLRLPEVLMDSSTGINAWPTNVAWWREPNQQLHIRFAPRIAMANRFRFRFLYMPVSAVSALKDKPPQFVALFFDLLSARAAFILLPRAGLNGEGYSQMRVMIDRELQQREDQFRRWLDVNTAQQSGMTEGYRGSARVRKGRSRWL